MTRPSHPDRIRDRSDLEALLAQATNYEELGPGQAPRGEVKLARTRRLLAAVGDPQEGPRTFHVAGTKGKGTVARMVDRVLREDGRRVGLYTSPHLEDLAERIAIGGEPAGDDVLARAADRCLPHVRASAGTDDAPTFFELLTAMAWLAFREAGCTDVVLETGLGGRLDATNVCRPDAVAITTIEREHVPVLGTTIPEIAAEKAGILKPGVPAATTARGEALGVIRARAAAVGAPLAVLGEDLVVEAARTLPGPRTEARVRLDGVALDLVLPVAGAHHAANAVLAAWGAHRLGVADDRVVAGLAGVRLPGVLEPLGGDPLVVVDGAHTPASAAAARAAADACWPGRRRVLLLAVLAGKDASAVAESARPGAAAAVVTSLPGPRGRRAASISGALAPFPAGPAEAIDDPTEALARARALAGPGGLVLATGSVRLAGLVRGLVTATERGSPFHGLRSRDAPGLGTSSSREPVEGGA
jgi:dihydrofolate synthase / folylpolyglutamate synthase